MDLRTLAPRLGNKGFFRRIVTALWHVSQRGVHHAIPQHRDKLVVQEVLRSFAVHEHRHFIDVGLKDPPVGHDRERTSSAGAVCLLLVNISPVSK